MKSGDEMDYTNEQIGIFHGLLKRKPRKAIESLKQVLSSVPQSLQFKFSCFNAHIQITLLAQRYAAIYLFANIFQSHFKKYVFLTKFLL